MVQLLIHSEYIRCLEDDHLVPQAAKSPRFLRGPDNASSRRKPDQFYLDKERAQLAEPRPHVTDSTNPDGSITDAALEEFDKEGLLIWISGVDKAVTRNKFKRRDLRELQRLQVEEEAAANLSGAANNPSSQSVLEQ